MFGEFPSNEVWRQSSSLVIKAEDTRYSPSKPEQNQSDHRSLTRDSELVMQEGEQGKPFWKRQQSQPHLVSGAVLIKTPAAPHSQSCQHWRCYTASRVHTRPVQYCVFGLCSSCNCSLRSHLPSLVSQPWCQVCELSQILKVLSLLLITGTLANTTSFPKRIQFQLSPQRKSLSPGGGFCEDCRTTPGLIES